MGYCMGGVLALALAQRRPKELAGLVLLATPWDFHSEADYRARLAISAAKQLEPVMANLKVLPVDAIQSLLSSLDPLLVVRKFLTFGRLDQASRKVEAFVALEDWLNDGIPLAAKVARECLSDWYGQNSTAKGDCIIAGRPLRPGQIDVRALSVIPAGDRIVPPTSARALADALPRGEVATPRAGHIGMMVSGSARGRVWEPLEAWLRS
jgi:polyhydroxyalkanoate synthase